MKTKKINYLTLTLILLGLFACKGIKVVEKKENSQINNVIDSNKLNKIACLPILEKPTINYGKDNEEFIVFNDSLKHSITIKKVGDNKIFEFSNLGMKDTIKFNLKENNPYINLNYIVKKNVEENSIYYQLPENTFVKSALPDFDNSYHYQKNVNDLEVKYLVPSEGRVYSSENENFQVVTYGLDAQGNDVVAATSTVKVLDINGNVFSELKNLNININDAAITNDGRYLAICHFYDTQYDTIINPGLKVYDTSTKRIVFSLDDRQYGCFSLGNYIRVSYSMVNDGIDLDFLQIFDFYNSLKYTKILNSRETRVIEVNKNGYLVKRENGTYFMSFEKDFNKEELK